MSNCWQQGGFTPICTTVSSHDQKKDPEGISLRVLPSCSAGTHAGGYVSVLQCSEKLYGCSAENAVPVPAQGKHQRITEHHAAGCFTQQDPQGLNPESARDAVSVDQYPRDNQGVGQNSRNGDQQRMTAQKIRDQGADRFGNAGKESIKFSTKR